MAYLGRSTDGFGIRDRFVYTAAGSETSVSGADDNARVLKYKDGAYVDVFLNGVLLLRGTDYNTTTGNAISGLAALTANDIIEVITYDVFAVANTVPKSGGTFNGEVTFVDSVALTGVTNIKEDVENITAATKSVLVGDSGTTYLLNRAGGIVVTLPVAAAGLRYSFIIGTTFTGTFSLDGASANDIFAASSNLLIWDKDAPATVSAKQFYADGSNDDKITMDSDGKGRFIGGKINCLGIATGGQGSATAVWHVDGIVYGDGTLATPFV